MRLTRLNINPAGRDAGLIAVIGVSSGGGA
jgi:hypothetical protein